MVDRIRELLSARQLTPTQFADAIQVSRPDISHILSGRNKPSLEVVQKIVAAFPDVSLNWLLNGTGPLLAAAVEPAVPVLPRARPSRPATDTARPTANISPVITPETGLPATQPVAVDNVVPQAIMEAAPAVSGTVGYEPAPAPVSATKRPAPQPTASTQNDGILSGLLEPGKAIRRIVIFYQDGTFADYQPEAK